MKKILSYSGIAILLITILIPVFSHAQTTRLEDCRVNPGNYGFSNPNQCSTIVNPQDPVNATLGERREADAPNPEASGSWFDLPNTLVTGILQIILEGILTIMSWLLWLSGYLLNFVLKYTIVDLSANISKLTGINVAWKVIRDLMNIAFIWLLLWHAINMIIGTAKPDIKKFISGIVLASILINFSLFFTKLLIDASNVVTVGFYNSILGESAAEQDYGLSNPIVRALGLPTIYNPDTPTTDFGEGKGVGAMLIMGFGSGLLLLIATFIFFAVAILFIVRYVALIILLMLSPIAYMGMALPSMQTHAKQWWDTLWGQLLFAPVYMIMTWVILTLMASDGFIVKGTWTDALSTATKPDFTVMGLVLNFAVIIGLLIFSMITAKSTASRGSSLIGKLTGQATAFAGGALMGTAGKVGRNTVGRFGNYVGNSERAKKWASSEATGLGGALTRFAGKSTMVTGDRIAKSTFDVRSTKVVGGLTKTLGLDLGKGADAKKVNFQKDLEAKGKRAADFAKTLKPTDAAVDKEKEKRQAVINTDKEKEKVNKNILKEEEERLAKFKEEEAKLKKDLEEINKKQSSREKTVDESQYEESLKKIAELEAKTAQLKKEQDEAISNTTKTEIQQKINENNADVEQRKVSLQLQKGRIDTGTAKQLEDDQREVSQIQEKIDQNKKNTEYYQEMVDDLKKKGKEANEGIEKAEKDLEKVGKEMFEERVKQYAKTFENENGMWRWSKNILKVVGGGAVGIGYMQSKGDNLAIAKAIRKETKEKSNKEKAAEFALKAAKDEEEEKKKETEGGGGTEDKDKPKDAAATT